MEQLLTAAPPARRYMFASRMPPQGTGSSFFAWCQKMCQYGVEGAAHNITCPTLVCYAEGEHLSTNQAPRLFEALTCPKQLHVFTHEEGAGHHCQALALARSYQVILDWADEVVENV